MDVQTFCDQLADDVIFNLFNKLSDEQQQIFVNAYFEIKKRYPECDVYTTSNKGQTFYFTIFGLKPLSNEKNKKQPKGKPKLLLSRFNNNVCLWENKNNKEIQQRLNLEKDFSRLTEWLRDFDTRYKVSMQGSNLNPNSYSSSEVASSASQFTAEKEFDEPFIESPLNQILYGPPGTGKTYHTVQAAVKAAEPFLYAELGINEDKGADKVQRKKLTELYRDLYDDKRIRFVTFHQSYGYEEFVEGLKAITNEDKQIEYKVTPGVFKKISEDATDSKDKKVLGLKSSTKIWKISIDGVKQSSIRDHCLQNGLAAIGWGNTGDMGADERSETEYYTGLTDKARNTIHNFCSRITEGELILCISSAKTIQAIGVVTGEYAYKDNGILDRKDFCHTLPVKWLVTDIELDIHKLNDNINLVQKTVYELDRFTTADLLKLVEEKGIELIKHSDSNSEDNYVLIIDEINRGNISKIFGELITLIEPSKRSGLDLHGKENSEALTVNLPHTPNKSFSVPNNLYIIGTMNTADRSLAMMDTALRRRFDFVEMMPDPKKLSGKLVNGIDLERLLIALNDRIEVLYDREHTLGHAFFMPVVDLRDGNEQKDIVADEKAAFDELQNIFKNKIIPLLEEYFFEDWNKIRLVLGDNQKTTTSSKINQKLEEYMFVQATTKKYSILFGDNHGIDDHEDEKTTYKLASFTDKDSPWIKEEVYQAIYSQNVLKLIIKKATQMANNETSGEGEQQPDGSDESEPTT